MQNANTIAFSVRVSTDVHILLCNSKNYYQDFCYWLIIGGWNNVRSIIRICREGVSKLGEFPPKTTECGTPKDEVKVRSIYNMQREHIICSILIRLIIVLYSMMLYLKFIGYFTACTVITNWMAIVSCYVELYEPICRYLWYR